MDRILLVEDEIGSIAALKRTLGRAGFDVVVATNGADALSIARHDRPLAIVLSGDLQDRSSEELRRSLEAAIRAPVILIGGAPGSREPQLARPVDGALLVDRLRDALSAPRDAPEPTPATRPHADGAAALAARRALLAARGQAERAAREKAEAAAKAARDRQQELQAERATGPGGAPPQQPEESSLATELFGDLSAAEDEPAPPSIEPPAPGLPSPEIPPKERAPAEIASAAPRSADASRQTPATKPPVPARGSVEELEAARLLAVCHRSGWSGSLAIREGATTRRLFWDSGRVCGATSNSADDRLENLAYRRGLLTREQQRQVRAEGLGGGRRAALTLVERAYLKPAELFPLVQERVEEIAYACCGCLRGEYELSEETVPTDERVALARSPLSLLTEGIRRKYRMERLVDALGGPATLLRPVEEAAPPISEFGLTAQERRLAAAVDGVRNVEELLFETGLDPLAGLQIFHALCLGGHLEIAVRGLPAELSHELDAVIDAGRVAEKLRQAREASYFDVLGIDPSATRYEVDQAYGRLARELDPLRFEPIEEPTLRAQLEEIQRVLAEAKDVLSDDTLRLQYARHRRSDRSL